ncbi:carboxymuconolactone decarboxylase family protein [Actinomadura atramentaria]|uniref:carboxymuconolactone decarboxylase family protein n=1 Tax=Actinomadura atramentaria TaxID=1990 RepID=UPI000361FC5C|nr:carboxymuconolactone decarboxylase family protein [Actinomadura atramentaria]
MTPRVRPGRLADTGLFTWLFARAAGRVARTAPPSLFLTLGRRPRLFHTWLLFAGSLMPGGSLPRRECELVILRVAHLRDCRYEFEHHVRLGRRAGVRSADVERLAAGPDAPGWTPREAALLTAVDRLQEGRDLDDAAWAALRRHLTEPECVEFLMLAGHYDMLATVITALRLVPDAPTGRRRP